MKIHRSMIYVRRLNPDSWFTYKSKLKPLCNLDSIRLRRIKHGPIFILKIYTCINFGIVTSYYILFYKCFIVDSLQPRYLFICSYFFFLPFIYFYFFSLCKRIQCIFLLMLQSPFSHKLFLFLLIHAILIQERNYKSSLVIVLNEWKLISKK